MVYERSDARVGMNNLGYDAQTATATKDLAIAQGQLRDYSARVGQPFVHEAYLAELARLRDQLKAGLSGMPPEPGVEPPPPVAELAERIKALKSASAIEPAPERAGPQKTRAAEEPVTARIRRLAEAVEPVLAAAPPDQPPAPESAAADPEPLAFPGILPLHPVAERRPAYRERIARRPSQLSLF
jgi:hypothetical protein